MSIQLLKKKIKKNQAYAPNQALLSLIVICESIGFNDVSDLDIQTYKQGSTVTLWNDDESIMFENNINNPSIYMDCGYNAQSYIKEKMTTTIQKLNGKAYGCEINFDLKGI